MTFRAMGGALCALTFIFAPPALAQSDIAAFEGVWTSRVELGSGLGGEIVISPDQNGWRASLAGAQAHATDFNFVFPDEAGRFERRPHSDWWIQAPGLPGVAYATPVRLQRAADGSWRGEVRPLAQTFTLHLALAHDETGVWRAAFRNPEFNTNAGASRFVARLEGEQILAQNSAGETVRALDVARGPQRLRVNWPPLPSPIELTRADTPPPGYLPRARGPYVYVRPERTGDGWRTRRAREAGFDEGALQAFVQTIIDGDPSAQRPNLIHSVLMARGGRLVLEEYFHGYGRDTPHDLRSAAKTFASLLMGVTMRAGGDIGPHTPLYSFLNAPPPDDDPRRRDITLAHLLTHTSGLDCDDYNEASPGGEGAMQGQSAEADWRRFALDLPMAHAPGARYAYCTAGINLVGAAIERASGARVIDLFDQAVAQPLDFGLYHWNLTPTGEGYLGGGVYMRPRDLAKIGQLYLDGGIWNGRRILDRDWVEISTAAHVAIDEATTGLDAERFAQTITRGADGFAWHRYGVRVGDRRIDSYEASGNGGQLLIMVPDYDLVVVITGGNYGQGGIWTRWRDDIVGGQIIAALRQ